jgi:hydroxyacylglutathione hydrolase
MLVDKLDNRSSAVTELGPDEVHRALADGALVIDGRTPEAYDACHVPGSVNVPMAGGELSSRLRSAVGGDPAVVAVAASDVESLTLVMMLDRAGCGGVDGILAGGVELGGAVLVDARDDEDWVRGHVPGSLHVPLRSVAAAAALLPRTPVVVACADGHRAATAASVLRRRGHANIWRVAGGGLPYLLSRRLNLGGI